MREKAGIYWLLSMVLIVPTRQSDSRGHRRERAAVWKRGSALWIIPDREKTHDGLLWEYDTPTGFVLSGESLVIKSVSVWNCAPRKGS